MFDDISFCRKSPVRLSALLIFFAVRMFFSVSSIGFSKDISSGEKHQPVVLELINVLEHRPDLKKALEDSIRKAELLDILDLAAYYNFSDKWVTAIPADKDWLPMRLEFYYIIDNSPNNKLQKDPVFQQWVHKFINNLGNFLDTTESAKGLETFYTDPDFHVNDYIKDPSGWLTFNQFFARHAKPGKRPIDGLCDDAVVVSPADSVFEGQWEINEKSEITAKGFKWSVLELLSDSPYKERFKGGIFIHGYLSPRDYHRFHVPVRGVVKEARKINGKVVLDVYKKEDGSLAVRNGVGYQFTQERGLIIIDSPVGLVAVVPIGMGIVSSVNLTAEKDITLAKGEEFGYFAFGGSDIIVMFEPGIKVSITAEAGVHYNQGKKIATVIKKQE